jgi:hypothetical protein
MATSWCKYKMIKKEKSPMIVGYYMSNDDPRPYPVFYSEKDDYKKRKIALTTEEAKKDCARRNK